MLRPVRDIGPGGRRRRTAERERTIHALQGLAAELRAGQPPTAALRHAAGNPPVWPVTLSGIALGADTAQLLYQDAQRDELLRPLAACWQVCETTGSGLALAVERLAESARVAEEVRTELEAQLAGPRATARMLAGLPIIGVLLGIALGGEPLQWLLGTSVGWLCLVIGVGLTLLGLAWTGRIASRVERTLS
ncbi:MAG: type II secretion system F family protein [Actinomycetales bacterium]